VFTTDITAVTVNWLTARRTLGAINSFKKFYPDIPIVVVDDDSQPKDKGEFYACYNGPTYNPDIDYDPDNDKLKHLDNVTFLQVPPHNVHPKSHGLSVDFAIKNITTRWMFHFHSDYRLLKPGLLEELTDGIDENTCAAGDNKTRHSQCPAVVSVAALYNVELGKKHNVTFKPVIYYNDDTISEYPGYIDPTKEGPVAIEAGSYFVGRLHQLGYKIKWVPTPHDRYGIHLRWNGSEEEYAKYF
jgi:hypothetical protein